MRFVCLRASGLAASEAAGPDRKTKAPHFREMIFPCDDAPVAMDISQLRLLVRAKNIELSKCPLARERDELQLKLDYLLVEEVLNECKIPAEDKLKARGLVSELLLGSKTPTQLAKQLKKAGIELLGRTGRTDVIDVLVKLYPYVEREHGTLLDRGSEWKLRDDFSSERRAAFMKVAVYFSSEKRV